MFYLCTFLEPDSNLQGGLVALHQKYISGLFCIAQKNLMTFRPPIR